jgi:hypothetical protein
VNEVSMASFTAAIHETGLFQFRDQFPYLGGIYLVLCCWSHNAARERRAEAARSADVASPTPRAC